MKKIFITSALLISCSFAQAGDAPNNSQSKNGLEITGEVVVTGEVTGGKCFTQATAYDVFAEELNVNAIAADMQAIGFLSNIAALTYNAPQTYTFDADPCNGANEDNPHFSITEEINIKYETVLSNGLTFAFEDEDFNFSTLSGNPSVTIGGAFGTIKFSEHISTIDSMLVGTAGSGADTAITPTSDGHVVRTSGSDSGLNVVYFTPSLYGMDFALGYNSNLSAGESGYNGNYKDTLSLGFGYETFIGDVVLSVGGAVEKTNINIETEQVCQEDDADRANQATSSYEFYAGLYGQDRCGGETLAAIGADVSFGEYTVSSAFSNLDTSLGSDMTVWSLGVAKTIDDIDYLIGYTTETLDYARENTDGKNLKDKSKILMLEATKPIGDGVDIGLNVSNTEVDNISEKLGNGRQDAWSAGVSFTVGF